MNYELLGKKVCEFFSVDKNVKNFLNNVLKNKKKVKEYVLKQCESKLVTRKNIEDALELINPAHNVEKKKIKLTKFSKEEIDKRRGIHNKAKEAFSNQITEYYVSNKIADKYSVITDRGINTFVKNMSSSPEEEIKIYKLIKEYKNTNDGIVKSSCREEIKKFFTKNINKCKETLEGITNIKNDEDLIEFYSKNQKILNTTSELQFNKNVEDNLFNKVENEFGFSFDNNIANDYYEKYSSFGVDATMIFSKVYAMANPLYPEIDLKEMASVRSLFIDLPSQIRPNSEPRKLADKLTVDDTEVTVKDNLNPLNSYGKVSENFSPVHLAEFRYGKDINDEFKYDLQISKLKNHLTFVLNTRGFEGKAEDYNYYDKTGLLVKSEDAFLRMAKGESLLVADKVSSNFIMEASSDPNNSFGFISNRSKFDVSKMYGIDNIIKENDKLLKDLQKAKDKKEHAWFGFTRKRYQKQIDDLSSKISLFNEKFTRNYNNYVKHGIHTMIDEVNTNILLKDENQKLYDVFLRKVNNLDSVNPSNKEMFNKALDEVNEASSKYISAKIESTEFKQNEDFLNRLKLVSDVKEACYNYKNLGREYQSVYNQNKEKINSVKPGLCKTLVFRENSERMNISELDDSIFLSELDPIENVEEKQMENIKI